MSPRALPGHYVGRPFNRAKELDVTDTAQSPSQATPLHAARSDRSRWMALVILGVGMLMIVLDATIVNVALPSIQSDLGVSQSSLAWGVHAYPIPCRGP